MILSEQEFNQKIKNLEEENSLLKNSMLGSNLGFFNYFYQSKTLQFNDRFAEILGYEFQELALLSFSEIIQLIHPTDYSNVNNIYSTFITNPSSNLEIEFRFKNKNNEWIWILLRAISIFSNNSSIPLSLSGSITDLNFRKNIESELQEKEILLNEAQRLSKTGNWVLNFENNHLYWSDEIYRMFEIDPLIFSSSYEAFLNAIHPDDREIVNNAYSDSLKTKEPYKIIHRLLLNNDEIKWVEESCETYFDNLGKPIRSVGTVQDITDRIVSENNLKSALDDLTLLKQNLEANLLQKNALIDELTNLKSKLENSNLEKDKLFSIIAHDLRAPFNGFLGLLKIINEDIEEFSLKNLRSYLNEMIVTAENLYELLDNLLDWSLVKRDAIKYYPEKLYLSQECQYIKDLLFDVLRKKNIFLDINIASDICIFGDKVMINSIIRNLISNAIKFSHYGNKIEIGIEKIIKPKENEICFFVKDFGIGMPSTIRDNLFKVNSDISRKGTNNEPSTGLGLIIVNEFVEKNEGHIFVQSCENQGTTFFVILKKAI